MPFPGVKVDVSTGNLLASINVPDAVPAVIGSSYPEGVTRLYSAEEYSWSKSDNVVGEFYAEVGGNTPLLCAGIASWSIDKVAAMVSTLLQGYPDVNLIAIGEGPSSHTFTQHGALCDDVVSLVTQLKPVLEARQAAGTPARVFLGGHVDLTKGEEITFSPKGAGNGYVGIVLGNAGVENSTRPAVGTALGRATKIAAHVKIGDGRLGPLAIEDVYFGAKSYDEVGTSRVEQWHDAGFITFMRRPGLEGWYFGVDNMCTNDDFAILAHGRVVDKAQRIVIATYMPYVESSLSMSDSGSIDAAEAEAMAKTLESQLRVQMGEEVSNVKVVIPTEQDLVNTHTLQVQVSVLPLGYNTWINVSIGLVSEL